MKRGIVLSAASGLFTCVARFFIWNRMEQEFFLNIKTPKMKTMLLAVLLTIVPVFAYAECSEGHYTLVCRGPLDAHHAVGLLSRGKIPLHEVVMNFTPSPSAAGERGTALAQGACSWADRGFRGGEPAELLLLLEEEPKQMGSALEGVLTAIEICNVNDNCRFSVCVRNNGSYMGGDGRSTMVMFDR